MFAARCRTTAMGIMPHKDVDRAIGLAMRLDIPFWPQLPNVSYTEDMYAQASEHFPGITIDEALGTLCFDNARFAEEIMEYALICDQEETFALSPEYSKTFHRFLQRDLSRFVAIRGQVIGIVSFGFRVIDENRRPVIYNDEVRPVLFEFIQRKVNHQYYEMLADNSNAFVWLDEPGLGWIFSALSGYGDEVARRDFQSFFANIVGPKALHLCADINLPFLLELGAEIVSFDTYQVGEIPAEYAAAVGRFINGGGIVSWGLVPTDSLNQGHENAESLAQRIDRTWQKVAKLSGLGVDEIANASLLAPSRCCLKNVGKVGSADEAVAISVSHNGSTSSDEETLVERAFCFLELISKELRLKYSIRE